MAVQARHLSHPFRLADDSAMFLDEFARCGAPAGTVPDTTLLRDLPRSDLTCGGYYGVEFEPPRKRARVADGFVVDAGLTPVPAHDAPCGVAMASTSGRAAPNVAAAGGYGADLFPSRACSHHDAEIDALIRLEVRDCCRGLAGIDA